MNRSGARTVDMTICDYDRLTRLIISLVTSRKLSGAHRRPSVGPQGAQRARAPTTANLKPGGRPTGPTGVSAAAESTCFWWLLWCSLTCCCCCSCALQVGGGLAADRRAGRPAGKRAGGRAGARAAARGEQQQREQQQQQQQREQQQQQQQRAASSSSGDARRARSSYKFKILDTCPWRP